MTRVGGADRYETAAQLSRHGFPDGAATVVIATGERFPDALAAGPVAKRLGAPLLLTEGGRLPAATLLEIDRLGARVGLLIGGPTAVSDAVLAELAGTLDEVTRIGGLDRYETASLLAAQHFPAPQPEAVVATGERFPDALAGGAAAAARDAPILLVRQDAVPDVVAAELERMAPEAVHVVGGTGAVGETVGTQLGALLPGGLLQRHAGVDRYATSAAVADQLFPVAVGSALAATGERFPDALAGSALGLPILLVAHDHVTEPVLAQVARLGSDGVVLLGGVDAVSEAVRDLLGA